MQSGFVEACYDATGAKSRSDAACTATCDTYESSHEIRVLRRSWAVDLRLHLPVLLARRHVAEGSNRCLNGPVLSALRRLRADAPRLAERHSPFSRRRAQALRQHDP